MLPALCFMVLRIACDMLAILHIVIAMRFFRRTLSIATQDTELAIQNGMHDGGLFDRRLLAAGTSGDGLEFEDQRRGESAADLGMELFDPMSAKNLFFMPTDGGNTMSIQKFVHAGLCRQGEAHFFDVMPIMHGLLQGTQEPHQCRNNVSALTKPAGRLWWLVCAWLFLPCANS